MTTEILQNNCFKKKNRGLYLDFNINKINQKRSEQGRNELLAESKSGENAAEVT